MENFTYWYFQLDQFTQLCVVSGIGVLVGLAMTLAFAALRSLVTGVVSLFHSWPGQERSPAKEERLPIPTNVRPDARKCCSRASACGLCLNPLYDCRTDTECDHMIEAIREGEEAKHLASLKETFDAVSQLRPERAAGEQYAAFNSLLEKLLLTLDGMAECNDTVVKALQTILRTPQRMPDLRAIEMDIGRVKRLMTDLFISMNIPLPAEVKTPAIAVPDVQVIKITDPQLVEELIKQALAAADPVTREEPPRDLRWLPVLPTAPPVTQAQLDATTAFIEQQAAASAQADKAERNANKKGK